MVFFYTINLRQVIQIKKWTEEMFNRAIELKNSGCTSREVAAILNHEFGCELTVMAINKKFSNEKRRKSNVELPGLDKQSSITINNDGTQVSHIQIRMTTEQSKSPSYVLLAHGYNPMLWTLDKAINNIWGQKIGEEPLYQSKIFVRPIKNGLDYEELFKELTNNLKPYEPKQKGVTGNEYLVIPIFDFHFGNATFEDYELPLLKTHKKISNGYKKILVILGGDLLHNDNHRGTTSSGTIIDKVDMEAAWKSAVKYIDSIIGKAAEHAECVEVVYIPGNHDEITGQTVALTLEMLHSKQSNVDFQTDKEMFKATLLGHNFIGMTHGDKSTWKKYHAKFSIIFSHLWGAEGVITREAFTGHLHHEAYKDIDGFMIRQAPTRAPIDGYHRDNAFDMSHKRFFLIEYDEYVPIGVYYV